MKGFERTRRVLSNSFSVGGNRSKCQDVRQDAAKESDDNEHDGCNELQEKWKELARFVPRLLRRTILSRIEDRTFVGGTTALPTSVNASRIQKAGFFVKPSFENSIAAVAVLDVSGFTTLTSDLSRFGKFGTDIIGKFLNSYFGQLIEAISLYDGDVFKFAGDALIVLFIPNAAERLHDDGGLVSVTRRATACITGIVDTYGE